MPAPLRLHGYDFNDVCFSPAPHGEAGGCCARHSGAGDAELNAAECRRTDCEFTFMVLVKASVLRCGMLLNMVQPIPHFVLSNLYHHPQTPYLISGPSVGKYIVRRVCTRLPSPPPFTGGVGDRRWLEGCLPSVACTGGPPLAVRTASPWRRSFLPVPLSALHPIALQWSKRTESVLIQQRPK